MELQKVGTTGISTDKIDKLMLDILDYAEKNNKILNQIQTLVNNSSKYFICDAGNSYRKKFNEFFNEASTVNKNILSYNDDYRSIKNHYLQVSKDAAENIKINASKHEFKDNFREEK